MRRYLALLLLCSLMVSQAIGFGNSAEPPSVMKGGYMITLLPI